MIGPRGLRREDGSASVWAVAASLLLVMVLAAGSVVADLLAARRRAATAADLAALAAAPAASWSSVGACAAAGSVAAANGAAVHACRLSAGDVWITASAQPRSRLARWVSDRLLEGTGPRVSAHAGLR